MMKQEKENDMDYKTAGVDIEAGYESVELMKKYVKETMRPEVLGGLGGFSGAFSTGFFSGTGFSAGTGSSPWIRRRNCSC